MSDILITIAVIIIVDILCLIRMRITTFDSNLECFIAVLVVDVLAMLLIIFDSNDLAYVITIIGSFLVAVLYFAYKEYKNKSDEKIDKHI